MLYTITNLMLVKLALLVDRKGFLEYLGFRVRIVNLQCAFMLIFFLFN